MSRLAALALLLALAGCGFHLRGEAPTGLKTIYLSSNVPSQVLAELRRQVTGSPTRVVATPGQAEAHLRILSESTEKNIQTLTAEGRVFDYSLRLKVGFQVMEGAEKALVEPAEIELRRIISYSATAPLAKEQEELLLFQDMRVEAASRILRRIAVVRGSAAR